MDTNSATVQLCIAGTRAEYEGRPDDARDLYQQAWDAAADDYDACVAAHYVARFQAEPAESLRWNLEALARAEVVAAEGEAGRARVEPFLASLYVNLGRAYERVGDEANATHYYGLAADRGLPHQME